MARYKGTVTQSTVDWYARNLQAAQQWFSSATASYWAFILQNNANNGASLWVYDAAVDSGAQFPAGIGNPGGNPNPPAGSSGASSGVPSAMGIPNQSSGGVNSGNSFTVNRPSVPAAGDLFVLILMGNFDPVFMSPPDSSWTLIGETNYTGVAPGLAIYIHICTGSEPASFTCTESHGADLYAGQILQITGNQHPGYLDQLQFNNGTTAQGTWTAPSVFNTASGDIVIIGAAAIQSLENFSGPAGFTALIELTESVLSLQGFFMAPAGAGVIGPFAGLSAHSTPHNTFTLTLKAKAPAAAPAQNLSAPIMTVTPVKPGLLTMQFDTAPLGLSGITKFMPPACNYRWTREAPIAIVGPGMNFNLAGIAPENAAWCDMTWLAIK